MAFKLFGIKLSISLILLSLIIYLIIVIHTITGCYNCKLKETFEDSGRNLLQQQTSINNKLINPETIIKSYKLNVDKLDKQSKILSTKLNDNYYINTNINYNNQSMANTDHVISTAKQYENTQYQINKLNKNMPTYNNIIGDSYIMLSHETFRFVLWCVLIIIFILIMILIYNNV
jgi:hypothetical protein